MSFLLYIKKEEFQASLWQVRIIFSKTPLVGLTATATKLTQRKIDESLRLIKPRVIEKNEASLPIYSRRNATAIWEIIQKYI